MEKHGVQLKRNHILRFWLVMLFCTAMIGAACYFAYTQTRQELRVQLETTVGSIRDMPAETVFTRPVTLPRGTEVRFAQTEQAEETERRVIETPSASELAEVFAPAPQTETAPLTELVTETEETTEPPERHEPVKGEILQPFSAGSLVKSPTTGVWQTHNGTDYAAPLGDSVRATAAGSVSQITEDALWGVTVTIDHKNGYITRYCNLGSSLSVSEGDTVEAGTVIGAVGQTADAESTLPPHVHFEVMKDGRFIDPETYLPG
ncbi:MAG: M23 family metallopeptidase [Oscillospiraceae bacterium]|nr:M23 family metallopeptidase [Oscillospiraceae bacterium]